MFAKTNIHRLYTRYISSKHYIQWYRKHKPSPLVISTTIISTVIKEASYPPPPPHYRCVHLSQFQLAPLNTLYRIVCICIMGISSLFSCKVSSLTETCMTKYHISHDRLTGIIPTYYSLHDTIVININMTADLPPNLHE